MLKYLLVSFILTLISFQGIADDWEQFIGEYEYIEYTLHKPDGSKYSLADLGSKSLSYTITANFEITLHKIQLDDSVITAKAKIEEIKIEDNVGFIVAHWEGMDYPVKNELRIDGNIWTSVIRFQDKTDKYRYGLKEVAVIKKL
jgi:hypothetical protein